MMDRIFRESKNKKNEPAEGKPLQDENAADLDAGSLEDLDSVLNKEL